MPTYQIPGLADFVVTDHEHDIASDLAVSTLYDLCGTAETHGDEPQTLVQIGIIAALRANSAGKLAHEATWDYRNPAG